MIFEFGSSSISRNNGRKTINAWLSWILIAEFTLLFVINTHMNGPVLKDYKVGKAIGAGSFSKVRYAVHLSSKTEVKSIKLGSNKNHQ